MPKISKISQCIIDGCDKQSYCKSLCHKHYYRQYRDGSLINLKRQTRNRGEGTITPKGYVRISVDDKSVLQHRLIMENKLGRQLLPNENVHHINGNKSDNRPENLELWVTTQPSGQRPYDLVAHAKEILTKYDESISQYEEDYHLW